MGFLMTPTVPSPKPLPSWCSNLWFHLNSLLKIQSWTPLFHQRRLHHTILLILSRCSPLQSCHGLLHSLLFPCRVSILCLCPMPLVVTLSILRLFLACSTTTSHGWYWWASVIAFLYLGDECYCLCHPYFCMSWCFLFKAYSIYLFHDPSSTSWDVRWCRSTTAIPYSRYTRAS